MQGPRRGRIALPAHCSLPCGLRLNRVMGLRLTMSSAPAPSIPVLEVTAAGYRFFARSWLTLAPVALLMAAAGGWTQLVARDMEAGLAASPPFINLTALASAAAVVLVATAAFQAAAYRLAVRGEHRGFFGFQFGEDELRLLAVMLILAAAGAALALAVGLGFALLLGGHATEAFAVAIGTPQSEAVHRELEAALAGPGGVAATTLLLAALILAMWATIRLALAQAATIADGRIRVFSTWGLTRGRVLAVLAVLLLASAPFSLLVGLVADALALTAFGSGPGAYAAASAPAVFAFGALFGFVQALAALPLVGAFGALHRRLASSGRRAD